MRLSTGLAIRKCTAISVTANNRITLSPVALDASATIDSGAVLENQLASIKGPMH